ncbi:MAG: ABC transporter ATP-binding protein, partial [Phycisphaerales bacterium]|nr:ABC transporter ATP-binding protein [Phycisphaerales bacterium]
PIEVLKDVSLEVHEGEIVTLIGSNGAGKTTTLMCVSGLNRVRSGRIVFDGHDLQDVSADRIVHRGLAQVPEGRKIFPRLSVRENLEMGAFIRNDRDGIEEDMGRAFALFPVLKQRQTQLGGTLSGGEQQMLAIARALMSRPKMLLMDEPSMGIAPLLVVKIFDAVRELNREGMTVLLVEQNACLALKLAHRGYVLETGEIVLSDAGSALLTHPRVREAYLGEV